MAQIFHPNTNAISRASIFGALFAVIIAGWLLDSFNRSDYWTERGVPRTQPVPFSHAHHVGDIGLDCRYCHGTVETQSFAGMPASEVCMGCHSQLFNKAAMLEPVRASVREQMPIRWNRVHHLKEFAYFNHSIHVAKGVGCSTCHGPVDEMPLMWKQNSLSMQWCLHCHRHPEEFVRPKEEVFNMAWKPPADQIEQGRKLVEQYHIAKLDVLRAAADGDEKTSEKTPIATLATWYAVRK